MKNGLSIRLSAVAKLIKDDKIVADIGTDHASLPIYLVNQGRAKKVYASDVNEGPIKIAKKNIERAGLGEKIEVFLSDGLKNLPTDTEEIVIAGMGGRLISEIIEDAPFVKDEKKGLILQPMSDSVTLRKYLYQKGFEIVKEFAFSDAGHLYSVIRAEYRGKVVSPTEVECRLGKILDNFGKYEKEYLKREIGKCEKKIEGMKKSKQKSKEIDFETSVKNELEKILRSSEK